MTHRFFDHTADVGVEVEAPDRASLFAEALRAFTDTLTPLEGVEADASGDRSIEREIELEAESLEELLMVWLEELLFLFEVDSLLFSGARVRLRESLEPGWEAETHPGSETYRLTAVARGETYDPDRHPLKVLIKGVTYHELKVEEAADGWHARIIFDI